MARGLLRLAVFAVLASAPACGYVCPEPDACPQFEGELASDDAERLALERAARYLSRKSLHARQAWFAIQGGLTLGGPFETWAQQLALESVDHELMRRAWLVETPPPALPIPTLTRAPELAPPTTNGERTQQSELMVYGVSCPTLDKKNRRRLRTLLLANGTGYLLVGQLWALIAARELDCAGGYDFEEQRSRMATQIYAELLADPDIHSLTVERMAALCYAGLCSWIPEDYFARLIADQHPVGGWLDPYFEAGMAARPKAVEMTTLAFYVLAHHHSQHAEVPK